MSTFTKRLVVHENDPENTFVVGDVKFVTEPLPDMAKVTCTSLSDTWDTFVQFIPLNRGVSIIGSSDGVVSFHY